MPFSTILRHSEISAESDVPTLLVSDSQSLTASSQHFWKCESALDKAHFSMAFLSVGHSERSRACREGPGHNSPNSYAGFPSSRIGDLRISSDSPGTRVGESRITLEMQDSAAFPLII